MFQDSASAPCVQSEHSIIGSCFSVLVGPLDEMIGPKRSSPRARSGNDPGKPGSNFIGGITGAFDALGDSLHLIKKVQDLEVIASAPSQMKRASFSIEFEVPAHCSRGLQLVLPFLRR